MATLSTSTTLYYSSIVTPTGDQTITGGAKNDNLSGGWGNDTIDGGAGNDAIYGSYGNDFITGGSGADVINGGDGIDTANYSGSSSYVYVNLAEGFGTYGDAQGDMLYGIENLVGSSFNDYLLGNYADNVLDGRAGNDTLYGYDGNDTLIGGTGGDYMNGGTGIDTADYSTSYGGVTIKLVDGKGYGGDAQGDTLVSIENVTGSSYSDYLFGNAEANVLDGGMGNDTLTGFDGADQLFGGYGNDSLDGGAGGDILNGGAGIDTAIYAKSMGSVYINLGKGAGYWNDAQGDTLTGIENVMGSSYNDYLYGDGQANVLDGYGGNDYLRGYAGNDTLLGGLGNDSLYGDTGNDTLDGGAGTNYLTGGDGADTFRFTKSATDTGTDTIWDYQDGQDLIDLSGTIIDDFAELQSNMSQNGSGVLIDIGEATIVIANTSLSVLDASDFIL